MGGAPTPDRDRGTHATTLISKLEVLKNLEQSITAQQKEFSSGPSGIYVEFISDPELELQVGSLESLRLGIELCSSKQNEDDTNSATVFIPDGKLGYFLDKVISYRDDDGKPNKEGITKPKNKALVESISDIKQAVVESLWTDDVGLLPNSLQYSIWWEVWIRISDQSDVSFFREHAEKIGFRLSAKDVSFVDRAVILAYGTREQIAQSILLMGIIAELRCAKEMAGSLLI